MMLTQRTSCESWPSRSVQTPAQQPSACAWVTCAVDRDPCDSDLCIGQEASSWQHAIRASGVACHPAQTATFPTHSVRTAASAARRRITRTTDRSMLDRRNGVK